MNTKNNNKMMIILFTIPALISFLVVFLYPVIRTILMSFFYVKNLTAGLSEWRFVGIDNYIRLVNIQLFKNSFMNIGKIWLFGGIAVTFFALLMAVILTSGIRFKSFFRAMIYLPNIISAVALANMWLHYVYNVRYGLFHKVFLMLGMKDLANLPWTSPQYIFMSMLIAFCFGSVGYYMLIYISGIEKIPNDLFESSKIEGANVFQSFFFITLPLLKGAFRTTLTLWSTNCLGFFVWSQLFSSAGREPSAALMTPIYYMYNIVFGEANASTSEFINAGMGAAICVILMILATILFMGIRFVIKDDKIQF